LNDNYVYFLARSSERAPWWIRAAQWALFLLWLLFSYWIFLGRGHNYLHQYFSVYHGVFADEVALKAGIFPNWGLVTLALAALVLWFQLLWVRCRVRIVKGESGWVWSGRSGPARPERAVLTPGGAWLSEKGRWFLVSKGYVDEEGKDWLLAAGASRLPLFHWRAAASPLTLALLALVAGAYFLQVPVRQHKQSLLAVFRAFEGGDAPLQVAAVEYPDFRPWVRYLSTLATCDKAACLKSQIADRLEMVCIGPTFSGDGGTLLGLLLLTGRAKLVLRALNPSPLQALDIAVRLRRPREARAIIAASPNAFGKAKEENELLLMEEGRFDDAWRQAEADKADDSLYSVKQRAVVAHVSGHREEARALAAQLLTPALLRQTRLEGDAPSTGLGALQRAVRDVKHKAAEALGNAVLGDLAQAERDWAEAQRLAGLAGIPGALDRECIYMDLVAPGEIWSHQGPIRK